MFDIENYVIDYIQTAYENAGMSVHVDSMLQSYPSEFPSITVREVQNVSLDSTRDDSLEEHHVSVRYQIDIIVAEKPIKANCKRLMAIADRAMQDLKFTRTDCDLSASEDRTLAWGTLVYRAVVGAPRTVGDNQIYQMYR